MGEDEVIELIGDTVSLCANTDAPQACYIQTSQGRFIVLVAKIEPACGAV